MRAELVAIAFGVFVAGCQPCESVSPCTTPLPLRPFCGGNGQCAVDGNAGWCGKLEGTPSGCVLARGQTLTVPLAGADIAKIPDLYIAFDDVRAGSAPHPKAAHVRLDGVAGEVFSTSTVSGVESAVFRFSPFPKDPKTLTLSFDDGGSTAVDLALDFEDGTCEKAHPVCTSPR